MDCVTGQLSWDGVLFGFQLRLCPVPRELEGHEDPKQPSILGQDMLGPLPDLYRVLAPLLWVPRGSELPRRTEALIAQQEPCLEEANGLQRR